MNCTELARALEREGIDPTYYWIEPVNEGKGVYEYMILRRAGLTWQILNKTRDVESNVRYYDAEEEACDAFLSALANNPNARSRLLTSFPDRAAADNFVARLSDAGISPTHRDVSVDHHGQRFRVFVDSRDFVRGKEIREGMNELPTT